MDMGTGDGSGLLVSTMWAKSRAPEHCLDPTSPGISSQCDFGPDPLTTSLVPCVPSFRGEPAATGQLVTKCAAAGVRVFLGVAKVTAVQPGRQETPAPRSSPAGQGAGPASCCVWHFVRYHLARREGMWPGQ